MTTSANSSPPSTSFARPTRDIYYSYRISRGEQGVLTFEPYKSHLLADWRFRTPSVAQASAETLFSRFLAFHEQDDFVGMDMSRKFIQMGMTRAKRYANHKGGRKYGSDGKELVKSEGHKDKQEKEESSRIFRGYWERCKGHQGYARLKEQFLKEQRDWEKSCKKGRLADQVDQNPARKKRKTVT